MPPPVAAERNRRRRRRTSPDGATLPTGPADRTSGAPARSTSRTTASPTTRISPSFALDLDRVRALLGGPGEKDAAHAGGSIQVNARRVLERLLVEAARFEPRRNAVRNAGPARDAIERVPAVIEQDAAARQPRIDAPVRDARPRSPRSRAGFSASASGRIATAPIAPSSISAEILRQIGASSQLCTVWTTRPARAAAAATRFCVLDARDQRLLAQHVKARVERPFDQRRMAARRRADIDEIELFAGQQIVDVSHATGHRDRPRETPPGATRRRRSPRRSSRRHGRASRARARWPRHCRSR